MPLTDDALQRLAQDILRKLQSNRAVLANTHRTLVIKVRPKGDGFDLEFVVHI